MRKVRNVLTPRERLTLDMINSHPEPYRPSQATLAKSLNVSQMTVSLDLRKIEKKGFSVKPGSPYRGRTTLLPTERSTVDLIDNSPGSVRPTNESIAKKLGLSTCGVWAIVTRLDGMGMLNKPRRTRGKFGDSLILACEENRFSGKRTEIVFGEVKRMVNQINGTMKTLEGLLTLDR